MKTIRTYIFLMTILVSCSKENIEPQEELTSPHLLTSVPIMTDSLEYYYNKLHDGLLSAPTVAIVPEEQYETIAELCTDTFGEYPWQVPSTVPIDSMALQFESQISDSGLSPLAKQRIRIMTDSLLIAEDGDQFIQLYGDYRDEVENNTLLQSEDKRVLFGTLWFIAMISQENMAMGTLSEDEDGGGREDEDWDISIGHVYNWLEGDLQSDAQGIHNALILSLDNNE